MSINIPSSISKTISDNQQQIYGDAKYLISNPEVLRESDSQRGLIEVNLTTREGIEYCINFISKEAINSNYKPNEEHSKSTGDYLSRPNLRVVDELSEQCIRNTLDDLVEKSDFGKIFVRKH
jgi:hypothetical protein